MIKTIYLFILTFLRKKTVLLCHGSQTYSFLQFQSSEIVGYFHKQSNECSICRQLVATTKYLTCFTVCACVARLACAGVPVDAINTGATILAGGAPALIDVWNRISQVSF